MINNVGKDCCGCLACMNICPKQAIKPIENVDGFIYPNVDINRCVECGLCENTCAFRHPNNNREIKSAYSFQIFDSDVLYNSSSGGFFSAVSRLVLHNGGHVVATQMNEKFDVKFVIASDYKSISSMRGSIYSQSYTGFIFQEIKSLLEKEEKVLFVGVPCQVDALLSYLSKNYEDLTTVELLCHGVPSNSFFKEHISYLEEKKHRKAISYKFRTKRYTWWPSAIEEITFSDNSTCSSIEAQAYNYFFHSNLSLRDSCMGCPYRARTRTADIIIGDFWDVEKISKIKDGRGTSIVYTTSDKGEKVVEKLKTYGKLTQFSIEEALYRISTEQNRKPMNRNEFWKEYALVGYSDLVHKYYTTSFKSRLKFLVKRRILLFNGKRKRKG